MSEQEWTAESVANQVGQFSIMQQKYERIAELHNAAKRNNLALLKDEYEGVLKDFAKLEKQLAAEREKREDSHICDLCGGVIKRGKHFCVSCAATEKQQLSAAVEALKRISAGEQDAFNISDAALAKIKKGK